jgi:mono/diheme cytochrome c family protein
LNTSGYRVALFALLLGACATVSRGAVAPSLERARALLPEGARLYVDRCARCHGQRGEGLAGAPDVFGPDALPVYPRRNASTESPTMTDPALLQLQIQTRPAGAPIRNALRTVEDLDQYVSSNLTGARAITSGDAWAIVSFMVAVQGGPTEPMDRARARSIPLPR